LKEYQNEISIAVIFEKLLTSDQELRIVVGLAPRNLKRVDDLDEQFKEETKRQGFLLRYHCGTTWHNYVTKVYQLTEADWKSLGTFVEKKIQNEFLPIAEKIGSYLNKNKAKDQIHQTID
jgi:hypothetical protein